VKDTLRWLCRDTDVWVEVTTLLIPGQNDGEDEIARLADWFVETLGPEVPLHFTAFHPDFKMTDLPNTPPATLTRARQQALSAGLKHVYTGNVHDASGQSTYCSHCNAVLIERDWYRLGRWNLDPTGACLSCGHPLAGRGLTQPPGTWGPKRLRLHIGA
jgi:pyruvate formate lyase activating enzyme